MVSQPGSDGGKMVLEDISEACHKAQAPCQLREQEFAGCVRSLGTRGRESAAQHDGVVAG